MQNKGDMKKIPTIKGNRIFEAASKAYPPKIQELPSKCGNEKIDGNSYYRSIYQQGYEQALKDVKKDIKVWFDEGAAVDYIVFENGNMCYDSERAAINLINFIFYGYKDKDCRFGDK